MSTKRPKIGYFERKKRGTKIKKVRQKCQFLIFYNEIFTVYAAFSENNFSQGSNLLHRGSYFTRGSYLFIGGLIYYIGGLI